MIGDVDGLRKVLVTAIDGATIELLGLGGGLPDVRADIVKGDGAEHLALVSNIIQFVFFHG